MAVAVVVAATPAGAEVKDATVSSDGNPWAEAARAPGYADATAHEPHYADKAVWPDLTGRERFVGATWPKGRRIVWARPGVSAGIRGAKATAHDLSNWIDAATGKPPASLLDEHTDVFLPPADEPYTVNWRKAGGGEHQPVKVRHVTVSPNAGWSSAGAYIHGNLWIKRGGRFGNHGACRFVGAEHTFFRNDNTGGLGVYAYRENPGTHMTQYFQFTKASPDVSVEVLGHSRAGDECRIEVGTIVVGVESVLQPGRNAVPYVKAEATLALMDGARFGKWCNQISDCDMELAGTLQGGLPERPLARDALFGLAYHNHNGTDFYDRHTGPPTHGMRFHNMNRRVAGMVVSEGARIRACTEDPAKATLVIGWFGLDAKEWEVEHALKRASGEDRAYMAKKLAGVPKKIAVVFEPKTRVENVRFDHVAEGGLVLLDPTVRAEWKNVSYGADCAGKPDERFARPKDYSARSRTY